MIRHQALTRLEALFFFEMFYNAVDVFMRDFAASYPVHELARIFAFFLVAAGEVSAVVEGADDVAPAFGSLLKRLDSGVFKHVLLVASDLVESVDVNFENLASSVLPPAAVAQAYNSVFARYNLQQLP